MPARSFTPEPVEEFGGEYTLPGNQQSVPAPRSPACQNVQFFPGRVATRPGFATAASFTGVGVLSIKDYTLLDTTQKRVLALTSDGQLWKEPGTLTFASVTTELVAASVAGALQMNSTTIFGREYMAFASGGFAGVATPRAYDDVNLDRVAPAGPAGAPTLFAGAAGSISAGPHLCRVLFRTRNGFLTAPGPAATFTFAGATKAAVSGIPTGPAYVIGRVLAFTPTCNTTEFYFIAGSAMDIRNNSQTTATVDFTDTALIAGTAVSTSANRDEDMLRLIELPQQAAVACYHNRLAWIGEAGSIIRNGDAGFLNLSFSGGFNGNTPLGWTELIGGESKATGITGLTGEGLKITGNGTNTRGQLENTENAAAILPSGEIRCRVRMKKSSGAGSACTFYVYIVSNITGATVSGMTVTASQLSSSEWRWIDGQVLNAASNTPDNTWRLRISSGGSDGGGTAIPNNEWLAVDALELYSGTASLNPHLIRWSRASQPDAYDGSTGIMTVNEKNGQRITAMFALGDNFYICKERSLFVSHDDGFNEPLSWPVALVSEVYGTPSAHGVGFGDQWVVIAGRAGLAYFAGGRPLSLSEDIRPTWNRINWAYGHLIWVAVDTERRLIQVGVPLDGATVPSTMIVLQYYGNSPTMDFFSGESTARNFNRWFVSDGSALTCWTGSERGDGTRLQLYGTNHTNGIVAKLDDTAHADFTTGAINSRYRMAYTGGPTLRRLFGKITCNAYGSGQFSVTGYLPDAATAVLPSNRGAPNVTLTSPMDNDIEWTIDATAERIAWEVATNAAGDWFSMQKFVPFDKSKPWTGERGTRGA